MVWALRTANFQKYTYQIFLPEGHLQAVDSENQLDRIKILSEGRPSRYFRTL